MIRPFGRLRLPWIALTAIVGALSMADEVKAGSCCVGGPVSRCECCVVAEDSPKAEAAGPANPSSAFESSRIAAPRPCECRSGEPSSPASRPESPRGQPRPDRDRLPARVSAFEARGSVEITPTSTRPDAPPKIPVYLRNARLLI